MRKKDELSKDHTCMQHAHDEEMVFVGHLPKKMTVESWWEFLCAAGLEGGPG
jgi:hypothetical protein